MNIVESVDSICRDSVDTQYIRTQQFKVTKSIKLASFYNNVPFIFKCFHDQYGA